MHEVRWAAMGTDAHVIVTASSAGLARRLTAAARNRIDAFERLWSRFLPESEVSRLNRTSTWVDLSDPTIELLEKSTAAQNVTGGRFDPFLLTSLEALGYDRSVELVAASPSDSTAIAIRLSRKGSGWERDGRSVRRTGDRRFDPGGIGKGLAADLVSEELMAAGACGALVNLGGDLRVRGCAPSGQQLWPITISEPRLRRRPLAVVDLVDSGLATSTPLRRHWGTGRHHLVDPTTGGSADGPDVVSVVAGEAWWAEAAATALAVDDGQVVPSVSALIVRGPHQRRVNGFERFEHGVAA